MCYLLRELRLQQVSQRSGPCEKVPADLQQASRDRNKAIQEVDGSTWDRLTSDEFTIVTASDGPVSKADRLSRFKTDKPSTSARSDEQLNVLEAIRRGDTSALKSALTSKVDPNTKDNRCDGADVRRRVRLGNGSFTRGSPRCWMRSSPHRCAGRPLPNGRRAPNKSRRTPRARPDISGFWLNDTATPLERPEAFAEQAFFTDAQAREYEQHYLEDRARALMGGVEDRTNADILEPGHVLPDRRTSLIVDPPTGKVPALTADAQKRNAARAQDRRAHPTDGPETGWRSS